MWRVFVKHMIKYKQITEQQDDMDRSILYPLEHHFHDYLWYLIRQDFIRDSDTLSISLLRHLNKDFYD